jgi:hypothetical protein
MNETEYISTIGDAYIRLRGRGLALSSLDSELMISWRERGVPLHVVMASIAEVFENRCHSNGAHPVRSLSYCAEEVDARYEEWLQTQVGKESVAHGGESSPGLLRLAIGAIDLAMSVEGLSFSQSVDRLRDAREFADSNLGGLSIAEVAVQYFKMARGLEYEAKAEVA